MDLKTFLVEMSKSWAWPIALGIFFWVFRSHIDRIVVTALRTLRRMQRIKFGDLEFATDVVAAAAARSDAAAVEVEEKIANPDLTAAERQRLVDQLKEVIGERERLRAILDANKAASAVNESTSSARRAIIGTLAQKEIVLHLGAKYFLERLEADRPGLVEEIEALLRSALEVRTWGAGHYLTRPGVHGMRKNGWLTEGFELTEDGLQALADTARRILGNSSAHS
jgi:hypothetical protein